MTLTLWFECKRPKYSRRKCKWREITGFMCWMQFDYNLTLFRYTLNCLSKSIYLSIFTHTHTHSPQPPGRRRAWRPVSPGSACWPPSTPPQPLTHQETFLRKYEDVICKLCISNLPEIIVSESNYGSEQRTAPVLGPGPGPGGGRNRRQIFTRSRGHCLWPQTTVLPVTTLQCL